MRTVVESSRLRQVGDMGVAVIEESAATSRPSSVVGVERDSEGLVRVRLGRTKSAGATVKIDGSFRQMRSVRSVYLDGHERSVSAAGSFFQEDEMPYDVVPAKTKDVTDFGRLTAAAKALAVSLAQFGPENEPSPEQLVVFMQGYQNLLEWRRKTREQMMKAEGQIDAVEVMLRQML